MLLMWEPKSGTAPVPRAVVRGLVFCGALFSLFRLFVGFSDWLFTGGDTLTVLFELLFVSEAELYWSSGEVERFTNLALQVAFIAPVDKFKVRAINYKPRWCGVSLNDVA